jgi:hypothetical protein
MAMSNNSTGLRTGVCTSTTRPTVPYEGQMIYETDTDKTLFWNGSAWVNVNSVSPAFTGTPTAPTATAGTNTTQLATTAFVTTAAANVTSGFRNVVINGGMDVWQRGTSTTSNNGFLADRWGVNWPTGITVSQETDVPSAQYRYSHKQIATATNSYSQFGQQIEFQNCKQFQNQATTISFYAKAINSNAGSTALVLRTRTIAGVDGYCRFAGTNVDTSITLTTSWAKYTVARTMPATFGSASLEFALGSHLSGDGFFVTGIQWELGAVATPFEFEDIGTTLAKCQRYYQRMIDPAGSGVNAGTTTAARVTFPLYTTMRAAPTSTMSGTLNFYNGSSTPTTTSINNAFNSVSYGQLDFIIAATGATGQALVMYTTGGSQYIDFNSEL